MEAILATRGYLRIVQGTDSRPADHTDPANTILMFDKKSENAAAIT